MFVVGVVVIGSGIVLFSSAMNIQHNRLTSAVKPDMHEHSPLYKRVGDRVSNPVFTETEKPGNPGFFQPPPICSERNDVTSKTENRFYKMNPV